MSNTIQADAAALRKLKLAAAEAKGRADDLKAKADEAEHQLFARMEEEGIEGLKYRGTQFVPAATTYGTVQDRGTFVKWANENDVSLVEVKERKALVNELVREKLDNGEELPPGLGFYVKEYISLRGAKDA